MTNPTPDPLVAAAIENAKSHRPGIMYSKELNSDLGILAAEVRRLQAALAEKEKRIETLCLEWAEDDTSIKAICAKNGINVDGDCWGFKGRIECMEELSQQLTASQQRVAVQSEFISACIGTADALAKAEADRDRMKAALEAVTNYGVELGDMYNAVMTKASHDLPINDAFSLADASAKVQSGPFSLTNAMNYFKQVKTLLGATDYNKITGVNDTKIALATPAAQAATEEKCICGKTANDCAVTACKPHQDGAPKP